MQQPAPGQRIGVFGGTFDPIHFGHLVVAQEAAWRLALDLVLFVPAGTPPHKPGPVTAPAHRRAMVALAVADNPRFAVATLELERAGPSYTVHTLAALRARQPEAAFTLILGGDMVYDVGNWRDPAGIARQVAAVAAVARPGFALDDARLVALAAQAPELRAKITLVSAPLLDISATQLRARMASDEPVRYLLPDPVIAYIMAHGLYRLAPDTA